MSLTDFLLAIPLTDACVLWPGSVNRSGYGRMSRNRLAHRVSYELHVADIPPGLTIDHLCYVKLCVNPAHLRVLTHNDNASNQLTAGATHCANGHEFTPENTYLRRTSTGTRPSCRRCNAHAASRASARKRDPDGGPEKIAGQQKRLRELAAQRHAEARSRALNIDPTRLSRVDVIDDAGRSFSRVGYDVEIDIQDDGRTLKVFLRMNPVKQEEYMANLRAALAGDQS